MLSTLATSCEELTHWKRLWCWEGLGAGGEGDDRGWDGWMASPTRWTWVWVNSGSWWWTGRPGVLRFMGLQRVGRDWATELNWTGWSLLPMLSDIYFLIFKLSYTIYVSELSILFHWYIFSQHDNTLVIIASKYVLFFSRLCFAMRAHGSHCSICFKTLFNRFNPVWQIHFYQKNLELVAK